MKFNLSDLKPHPKNPRRIDPARFEALKRNIQHGTLLRTDWNPDSGYRLLTTITVTKRGNVILSGHQRCAALKDLGQDWIHQDDITWVDVDPDDQNALLQLVNLNSIKNQGEYTDEIFEVLDTIKRLDAALFESNDMGEFMTELDSVMNTHSYVPEDENEERVPGESAPPIPQELRQYMVSVPADRSKDFEDRFKGMIGECSYDIDLDRID